MTTTDTRTPALEAAYDRINEAINGLTALIEFLAANPELAGAVQLRLSDINVFVSDRNLPEGSTIPERIAALAGSAVNHGAVARQHSSGEWAGVMADFGPVPVHIYSRLANVGEVSTRMVEVTDWQPAPELAAFAGSEPTR